MAGEDEERKNEDEKDLELDLMAEAELLRLTRQYRIMEGDKEAYSDEAQKVLRRQRKYLADLEREKKEVSRMLRVSKSARNIKIDKERSASMAKLAEEQEKLLTAIDEEKMHLSDIEREIRRLEKQIAAQRLKMASGRPNSSQTVKDKKDVSQKILLLENRLDGVMINFNATLAHNTSIRKEIDHLVGERSQFNEMIAKLQKKIAANKKTISDLTELAIQAYDQRDEAQSKIEAMKEKNEKDSRNFMEEMKELQRTLDHDEKLKNFLFHKSNDRAFASDMGDEDKGKSRKVEEAREKENVTKYRAAFEEIKKILGATDNVTLEKVTTDFVRIEDANFALFNYVTEMNNQVETLQDSIAKLKQDIKEARERGEEKERQQKEQVRQMEKRLDDSEMEADKTETKLKLMESVLGKLKLGAEELYMKCDCGSTPILSLLGETKVEPERPFVTDSNIIMYLDMVHEKIVELKGIVQFIEYQESKLLEQQETKGGHHKGKKGAHKALAEKEDKAAPGAILGRMDAKKQAGPGQEFEGEDEDEPEGGDSDSSEKASKPMDVSFLKTRAFVVNTREKKEEESGSVSALMAPKQTSRLAKKT